MKRIILGRVRTIFRTWDIQIDDNRLLAAAHDHGLNWLVGASIQFLMRNVRRHIDEISRPGLIHEFELIAPAKTRAPAHDINHSLQLTMVMRTSLGTRLHDDRPGPQFLRSHSRPRDRFRTRHSGCLRSVRIEFATANDPQTVFSPIKFCAGL